MGSLIQSQTSLTLKERLQMKRNAPVLLIDVSSSMSGDVEPGCSKAEAVNSILKGIPHAVTVFAFNQYVTECTKTTVPAPAGGTALSPALRLMHARGLKEAVVITDGEVNKWDWESSLEQVKGITLRVLYVGPGPKPEFLEKLANASGGFCSQEDLHEAKQLENKIKGLLGEAPKGRTIQL